MNTYYVVESNEKVTESVLEYLNQGDKIFLDVRGSPVAASECPGRSPCQISPAVPEGSAFQRANRRYKQ